jgi:hypothetical protein
MGIARILEELDAEIQKLKQARSLLSGGAASTTNTGVGTLAKRKPGRPKATATLTTSMPVAKKKRNLSPEGRKRIAEAVRRRWANQKKTAK